MLNNKKNQISEKYNLKICKRKNGTAENFMNLERQRGNGSL